MTSTIYFLWEIKLFCVFLIIETMTFMSFNILLISYPTLLLGAGDLQFHLYGYIDAILSVLAQSLYLTYVQKTGVEENVSTLSVLHLNSINCILPLLGYTMFNGNLLSAVRFEGFLNTSFSVRIDFYFHMFFEIRESSC